MGLELPEETRLREDRERLKDWKRWGPYLPDRQWGTVREDYSHNGNWWNDFSHDQARSRVYRWGEDGLLGLCDRQCRLAFGLALWNHHDPILKERLYGETEGQGMGVKECYYFLDSTPTHSYMRALYKYPQTAFPHQAGLFDDDRYFDVFVEYAKANPNDIAIRISIVNRANKEAPLTLLPSLWFRNVWGWGRRGEGFGPEPRMWLEDGRVHCDDEELGRFLFEIEGAEDYLFTNNESNLELLYKVPNTSPYVKDAFHRCIVEGCPEAVNPQKTGTKCAGLLRLNIPAGETVELRMRLWSPTEAPAQIFGNTFDRLMARALKEADDFYEAHGQGHLEGEESAVWRQAMAGLLWSKKFYNYAVDQWLQGDPAHPSPPPQRLQGRNHKWSGHLYNRDILMVPDAWAYPYYRSWDNAFQVLPLARIDPDLAKEQLLLQTRDCYMHPNGQFPANEVNFDEMNPPVHAWAALQLYRRCGRDDRAFLARIFHKLLLNFTWWAAQNHEAIPQGNQWMAFYCVEMLQIALELSRKDPVYQDLACKFLEHFVHFTASEDAELTALPLLAVELLDAAAFDQMPQFQARLQWLLSNRPHLANHLRRRDDKILLSVVNQERLQSILKRVLDPKEFLSDHGLRSMTRKSQDESDWPGTISFPLNYLLAESLERLDQFYQNDLIVEFPTRSRNKKNLGEVSRALQQRLISLFMPGKKGQRPAHGTDQRYAKKAGWKYLTLFYEFFDGDSGRGLGASHHTGWTALVASLMEHGSQERQGGKNG